MPPEGLSLFSHDAILRYEEIAKIVRVAAENGVSEIRITGGEPLVRAGLPSLVSMIRNTPGIKDISLTTNGILLEKYAEPLAQAGLNRINISLDTLDPEKFSRITRGGSLETLWKGVKAAVECGLEPIKFNTVVMRGINDDELHTIAQLSVENPWHMRFIELMPISNQAEWGDGFPKPADLYYSIKEMREQLGSLLLEHVNEKVGSGPAREYRIPGAKGHIGFISSIGEHFCESCNRLRLTADGHLRPCLLSDHEIPILPALRRGEDILPYLQQAVHQKPLGHELKVNRRPVVRCMTQIGG
jgi:cyclic pyranopterin phosphate synthase